MGHRYWWKQGNRVEDQVGRVSDVVRVTQTGIYIYFVVMSVFCCRVRCFWVSASQGFCVFLFFVFLSVLIFFSFPMVVLVLGIGMLVHLSGR